MLGVVKEGELTGGNPIATAARHGGELPTQENPRRLQKQHSDIVYNVKYVVTYFPTAQSFSI
jgi:hypothetical protein